MSQDSVYNLLKKNNEWMTTREIAEKDKTSCGTSLRSLNVLFRCREIQRKRDRKEGRTFYTYYWRFRWNRCRT
jgi:predicted transcriptional regulator